MKQLFSIPNLLSLGNLLCGCIAILNVIDGNIGVAIYLVLVACVFDFLDGFAARGLKQGSPMGKELDSLADMVTFGVVPGMVMFQLLHFTFKVETENDFYWYLYLPYIGFLIPLFSGLRLAKFNVDTRQSESFIGLPTLANALFICGLPLIIRYETGQMPSSYESPEWRGFMYSEQFAGLSEVPDFLINLVFTRWLLVALTVIFSVLLVSPIPMFSFKMKSVKWKDNQIRFIFLAVAALLFGWLKLAALPVIVVVYILMSGIYAFAKGPGHRQL